MWNFNYLNTLTATPLRHARLFSHARQSEITLLFVHGGFHGAWCWSLFLHFFELQNIKCAAIDLRGHGGLVQASGFARDGMSAMAADVIEAADTIGGEIVLIGHSAGALAAMLAALRIKPRGLILIAPATPDGVGSPQHVPPFAPDRAIAVPDAKRVRKWFLQGAENIDINAVLARLCPESPAFMNDCFQNRAQIDPKGIAVPTLCLSSELDRSPLHTPEQDKAVATFLNAAHQTIRGAGHSLMIEPLWRTGAVAILDWLRRNGLTPVQLA